MHQVEMKSKYFHFEFLIVIEFIKPVILSNSKSYLMYGC